MGPQLGTAVYELGQPADSLPEIGIRAGQADPDRVLGDLTKRRSGSDRDATLAKQLQGEITGSEARGRDVGHAVEGSLRVGDVELGVLEDLNDRVAATAVGGVHLGDAL